MDDAVNRRTLAGDVAILRTATHYALALLVAKVRHWARTDASTDLAAAAFVLLPSALLIYALFR